MKIRIKGNSIRLRMGQEEVKTLFDSGSLKELTVISPSSQWSYSISKSNHPDVGVELNDKSIDVLVPISKIDLWANSDKVSIDELVDNGTDGGLRVLIEKDFACLTERKGEDDSDAFPNPNSHC